MFQSLLLSSRGHNLPHGDKLFVIITFWIILGENFIGISQINEQKAEGKTSAQKKISSTCSYIHVKNLVFQRVCAF